MTPALGDHIRVSRTLYTHHGILVGANEVIHYSGEPLEKIHASVRLDSLETFLGEGTIEVVTYSAALPVEETIAKARSRLSESGYHLVFNNCEHFARWCKTGDHASDQVNDAVAATAGVGAGGVLVAAGVGVVSAGGAVAGLSGAGIMSGLATVGGVVGAGAIGGIVALAAAPAAVTTIAMQIVLTDDEKLSDQEREARKVGRVATAAGGVATAAGTVAAISASGVVGLSAAGITSGLAGIGATVGGGMLAGTVMAIGAPAVGAAAVGYGAYRIWKRMRGAKAEDDPGPTGAATTS